MRVLGIDPGLAQCGYGVLEKRGHEFKALDWGVIATPAAEPYGRRLASLYRAMLTLLVEFEPDAASFELNHFGVRAVAQATETTQARGVLLLCCALQDIPFSEFTPQQVKLNVTGDAKADKAEVQKAVALILDMPKVPTPNHAADALAVAYSHLALDTAAGL